MGMARLEGMKSGTDVDWDEQMKKRVVEKEIYDGRAKMWQVRKTEDPALCQRRRRA